MIIPRFRYVLTLGELAAAWRVSRTAPECGRFLQALAVAAPHERIWPTASGRSALWLALTSLGQQGKEVVVPGYACPVVSDTVLRAGYIPHFCDVQKKDFSYDPASLSRALGKDTAAIISVYIAGIPHDTSPVKEECRARGIPLIEDCCQSLGSRDNDTMLGAGADMAVYSFGIGKELHSGGGMLAASEQWAASIQEEYGSFRKAPNHAWIPTAFQGYAYSTLARNRFAYAAFSGVVSRMEQRQKQPPSAEGYRMRMPGFSCCLAVRKMSGLQDAIAARAAMVRAWKKALAGIPYISWPQAGSTSSPSYLRMIFYVDPGLRGPFIRWCRKGGIECLSKAEPMPWHHLGKGRYLSGPLPATQEINDSAVALPADECVTAKEFEYMREHVMRFKP